MCLQGLYRENLYFFLYHYLQTWKLVLWVRITLCTSEHQGCQIPSSFTFPNTETRGSAAPECAAPPTASNLCVIRGHKLKNHSFFPSRIYRLTPTNCRGQVGSEQSNKISTLRQTTDDTSAGQAKGHLTMLYQMRVYVQSITSDMHTKQF